MNLPKITIITPSFNQGQYLEQTICSVLDQNYTNLEYLIFDGGSKDQSVEIIKKYQKFLTHWESKPDKGQSHAINKGLKMATGEIINWLNSDDRYLPDCLQKVADAFAHPRVKVVCGKSRIFRDDDTFIKFSTGTDIYFDDLHKTIGWARIDQPETFFRKSATDKMQLLNPDLQYIMDREWWIRYLLLFGLENIAQIDDILVNFRYHEKSKTVSQSAAFEDENMGLYYALCANCNLEVELKTFTELGVYKGAVELEFPFHLNEKLIQKAIHYFFLLKGDQYYARNDRHKASVCLKAVNPDLLSYDEKKLVRRLLFRNQFLPLWLIKLFRSKEI